MLTEDSPGHHPSVAIKFLIDGKHSVNIFGMESFHATSSWNFFEHDLTSRVMTAADWEAIQPDTVDAIMQETVFKKMIEGSDRPFALSVGKPANTENDGTSLHKNDTVAPYEI